MDRLEIIFKSVVPHKNFITPDVEGYFERGNYVCELSRGEFCGIKMYGVTVVDKTTKTHCCDICKSFSGSRAKEQAMEYIDSLS